VCASVYNTNINFFRLSSQPSGITVVLCIMVYTRFIHGLYMVYTWFIHGLYMVLMRLYLIPSLIDVVILILLKHR